MSDFKTSTCTGVRREVKRCTRRCEGRVGSVLACVCAFEAAHNQKVGDLVTGWGAVLERGVAAAAAVARSSATSPRGFSSGRALEALPPRHPPPRLLGSL